MKDCKTTLNLALVALKKKESERDRGRQADPDDDVGRDPGSSKSGW